MSWETIKSILREGRDAPLYHHSNLMDAYRILKTNTMNGHDGTVMRDTNTRIKNGISLTRHVTKNMIKKFGPIVMVFDQRKLAQTYKIRAYADIDSIDLRRDEAEEVVVGPIENVTRYISKILVKQPYNNDSFDPFIYGIFKEMAQLKRIEVVEDRGIHVNKF